MVNFSSQIFSKFSSSKLEHKENLVVEELYLSHALSFSMDPSVQVSGGKTVLLTGGYGSSIGLPHHSNLSKPTKPSRGRSITLMIGPLLQPASLLTPFSLSFSVSTLVSHY